MNLEQDVGIITKDIANKGSNALSYILVTYVMNIYVLVHAAKDNPANKDILENANSG